MEIKTLEDLLRYRIGALVVENEALRVENEELKQQLKDIKPEDPE